MSTSIYQCALSFQNVDVDDDVDALGAMSFKKLHVGSKKKFTTEKMTINKRHQHLRKLGVFQVPNRQFINAGRNLRQSPPPKTHVES